MWTLLITALVNLLVFFFEQWWQHHHPARPGENERAQFIAEIGKFKHFWMGPRRQEYADKLFDKFVQNYDARPPIMAHEGPCLGSEAATFAARYAEGLTLDKATKR